MATNKKSTDTISDELLQVLTLMSKNSANLTDSVQTIANVVDGMCDHMKLMLDMLDTTIERIDAIEGGVADRNAGDDTTSAAQWLDRVRCEAEAAQDTTSDLVRDLSEGRKVDAALWLASAVSVNALLHDIIRIIEEEVPECA